MTITRTILRAKGAAAAGYSLIELMISMAVMTVVMGVTMQGLSDAMKANDAVLMLTGTNSAVRAGMDLIVRDLLQVGSGLPPGHVILTPSGAGASPFKIPGPPTTNFTSVSGDTDIGALIPGPGLGPVVNGNATDVLTVLMADNTFVDVGLTALTSTTVDVAAGLNIATGPDKVSPGQLMMISKGSISTLLQVTAVDTAARRLTFTDNDSLLVNQSGAAAGNLTALNAATPANDPTATRISRIRMITYYLDATVDPAHPRLVRRINNGDPLTFDNTSGTAVAIDIENLVFTFDLNDGATNPAGVRMTNTDQNTNGGACTPNLCSVTQIRKVNITITGRSRNVVNRNNRIFRNTLTSQVSLRGMAFVDDYHVP